MLLLLGCPSGGRAPRTPAPPPDQATAGIPEAERPFLVDPFDGWDRAVDPEAEARLRDAHRALARSGDGAAARAEAEAVLSGSPDLHPALVLAAQADLLAGDAAGAFDRLEPVAEESPFYTAARLLRGRAAEKLSRVPAAYAEYRAIADASPIAADRASVLEPRAIEIVGSRFRSALEQERLDEAAGHLDRLRRWAPDALETLEGGRALAEARGDRQAELDAVTRLLERDPDRRELLERRGELELEVGDASRGLQIFQGLAEANPDDARLQDRLEQAKFRWRLTLLPAHVQEISLSSELTRADFAVLVHWLVPRVRTSRAPAGRIANDILEHPRRTEIARVLNLRLMEIDPTLHTFSPDRPVRRIRALGTLLRAIETLGGGAACLAGPAGAGDVSGDGSVAGPVCETAVRCELVADPSGCDEEAPVSGTEALELIRRALQLFS